jgi:hypothetical protein
VVIFVRAPAIRISAPIPRPPFARSRWGPRLSSWRKKKYDGVYDADPEVDADARLIRSISHGKLWSAV